MKNLGFLLEILYLEKLGNSYGILLRLEKFEKNSFFDKFALIL